MNNALLQSLKSDGSMTQNQLAGFPLEMKLSRGLNEEKLDCVSGRKKIPPEKLTKNHRIRSCIFV